MASGGPMKATCLRPKLSRPTVAHATYRYSGHTPLAQSRRHCSVDIVAPNARAPREADMATLDGSALFHRVPDRFV
jgi:hypothetical protein